MATGSDITFIVEYRCPRCDASLEARTSQADGWLRCPRCGRAGLPPEYMKASPPGARALLGEDVLIIGPDSPDDPARGRPPFRRLTSLLAMFMSLLIVLAAVIVQNELAAASFTLVSLVCLAVALYPARRNRS